MSAEIDARQDQAANMQPGHNNNDSRLFPTEMGNGRLKLVVSELAASVIVPTCGRPHLLNRCLNSLAAQQFDPERYEIIVVDDGPSEDTHEVVEDWAGRMEGTGPRITYIASNGPHGPAAARNKGWQAACGAVLAFTDDDTIAHPDWLMQGVHAFVPGVDAVTGRIVMPLSATPTDYELDAKNLETAEFVTANCFVRRQVMAEMGGFDERFRFAWREDSDLHFRLLVRRARIVHAPQAVVTHPIRAAGWGVSLKQTRKVQFDALLFKKHPDLYRLRIRATPRWDFYVTVAALLLCVGAFASGAKLAATLTGLAWLFMTARFCAQRLKHTTKAPAHVAEMLVTSALIPPMAVFWRAVGAWRFRVTFL